MKIYQSILDLIGNTPMIEFQKIGKDFSSTLYGKIEYYNPGGSLKARVAQSMIETAEKRKILLPGMTIVEPTSGNTGIGIALIASLKGYKAIIIMPDGASLERQKILRAYGAEVIITSKEGGMKGAIAKAQEMKINDSNIYIPMQFDNPANPNAHKLTTAYEIWTDMDGKVDVFVAAVGTGGTITGNGEFLKRLNPKLEIIAVEPESSKVLSGGKASPHKIQGMGAGFIPNILNMQIIDQIISVTEQEAFEMTRRIAREEGLFLGMSSGAAVCAALKYAEKQTKPNNVVIILPDSGDRYLSTDLWI